MTRRNWTGVATMGLAIAFNIPYAVLATAFDYPEILRYSAASVLTRYADGGMQIFLSWYGFLLAALALVPIGAAISITADRLVRRPALAIGAAIVAGLAGVTQAIGLARWVFVVPALARQHGNPGTSAEGRRAVERAFEILNTYGGVGIGESIGQVLFALFIAQVAAMQWQERQRPCAVFGLATAVLIAIGTGQGIAGPVGVDPFPFVVATTTGFMALTGWLIAAAIPLLRAPSAA